MSAVGVALLRGTVLTRAATPSSAMGDYPWDRRRSRSPAPALPCGSGLKSAPAEQRGAPSRLQTPFAVAPAAALEHKRPLNVRTTVRTTCPRASGSEQ